MDKRYIKLLDKLYLDYEEETKHEFLSCYIFDFTTYDSELDRYFSVNMIKVLDAILNKTTFQYIALSYDNYLNFITMCNMPFLSDKIEWGTSIRGAWFNNPSGELDILFGTTIPGNEMQIFITQLIEWSKI